VILALKIATKLLGIVRNKISQAYLSKVYVKRLVFSTVLLHRLKPFSLETKGFSVQVEEEKQRPGTTGNCVAIVESIRQCAASSATHRV
jgi:hypothetical protein